MSKKGKAPVIHNSKMVQTLHFTHKSSDQTSRPSLLEYFVPRFFIFMRTSTRK